MPSTDRLRSALSDHYAIDREIGSGGMATVYLARDLKHDREVALKVLRAELSAVIGTERFLSEVRIAARLDHPHILTLIDSGSADGILYYVLPYVRGESLRTKLEREKQLSVEEALSIVTQVASALDYAHDQGVVHRDIKPENILLHHGEAVLADFGIALAVKEAGGNRLTETGLSLGTPQYMSPEQATGDRALDRRSDVYSLGAVFYEMIAGEPPVTGATAQAMIAKLLTERPVRLRVVRQTVSLAMERATEKALAKVAADRFATAGAFARALAVAAPERETASSFSRVKLALIAVAAIGLIGAGVWLARGRSTEPSRTAVTLRDRTQLTSTGRVSLPAISDDGKTIAYVVTDCGARGCRYGIEMQDVAGGSSRRILEGASALYGLEISTDRRNILLIGSINGVYGSFIVSTLGGAPRYLLAGQAVFYAKGDSLLMVRNSPPADTLWILVTGLDGIPADSIPVAGPAETIPGFSSVPNSQRIFYAFVKDSRVTWVSSDRSGKRYWTRDFTRDRAMAIFATSDALWTWMKSPSSPTGAIVRIPFDAKSNQLAERRDTVYRGSLTSFSVTEDGGTILLDEGSTEYAVWALSLDDALNGRFTDDKRIARGTSAITASLAPDGSGIALRRSAGSGGGDVREWTIRPFEGGPETIIRGNHRRLWLVDSATVGLLDATPSGSRLSLMDYRTRRRSRLLALPDSQQVDFDRIGSDGWAWIPDSGREILVRRDSEARARRFAVPAWFNNVFFARSSPDGRRLAFVGWNAPALDSIGIGILTVADGKFTQVWTTFGEGGAIRWINNDSLGIVINDTPESSTFYRTGIGGQVQRLGSAPRPVIGVTMSRDMKRAVVTTRDYRGDAWMSKVVR